MAEQLLANSFVVIKKLVKRVLILGYDRFKRSEGWDIRVSLQRLKVDKSYPVPA